MLCDTVCVAKLDPALVDLLRWLPFAERTAVDDDVADFASSICDFVLTSLRAL